MAKHEPIHLSRRERQIMHIVYELGRATVAQVRERLPDPPGYSAVRAMLRLLEEKGHLRHRQDGPRYVYLATVPRDKARRSDSNRSTASTFWNLPKMRPTAVRPADLAPRTTPPRQPVWRNAFRAPCRLIPRAQSPCRPRRF